MRVKITFWSIFVAYIYKTVFYVKDIFLINKIIFIRFLIWSIKINNFLLIKYLLFVEIFVLFKCNLV